MVDMWAIEMEGNLAMRLAISKALSLEMELDW
jgi:hypothetical protein